MPMRPRVGGEVMPGGREGDGGGVGEMAARVSGIGTDADADAKAEAHHQEQEERSGRCRTFFFEMGAAELGEGGGTGCPRRRWKRNKREPDFMRGRAVERTSPRPGCRTSNAKLKMGR
jgi:hypothetical protein